MRKSSLRIRWGVTGAYAALLTWLCTAPAETFSALPLVFPQSDKAVHFILFGMLAFLIRWSLSSTASLGNGWGAPAVRAGWVLAAAIAYGALTEVLQLFLVRYQRSFEWLDLLANTLGALSFWYLYGVFNRAPVAQTVEGHALDPGR